MFSLIFPSPPLDMFRLLVTKRTACSRITPGVRWSEDATKRTSWCHHRRELLSSSSKTPRRGPWSSLSESERAAWQVLGWDADQWDNPSRPAPPSSFNTWSRLTSSEKAAAKHGLGFSPEGWDFLVDKGLRSDEKQFEMTVNDDKAALPRTLKSVSATSVAAPTTATPSENYTLTSRLKKAAWNAARVVAPGTVNAIVERSMPPIVVNDIETTVYLDNSPSMKETMGSGGWFGTSTTRLDEGKKALESLAPALGSLPCRVLKFSNRPSVLRLREEGSSGSSSSLPQKFHGKPGGGGSGSSGISSSLPQITSGWDGSGVGTYLWHMIQEDVVERYRPGQGRLRLVVVTDGQDNMSPADYRGMKGMDPMMRALQAAGYDIEWHIIVIGGESGLERYKSLAGATGGSFLAIDKEFDKNSRETTAFLKAIESGTDEQSRRERQRRYEKEVKEGKAEKMDWYKRLPSGKK